MSDGPYCACLKVMYQTKSVENGATVGWWECNLCGNKFVPERLVEFQVEHRVAAAERNLAVSQSEGVRMCLALQKERDAAIAEVMVWKKEHGKIHGDWLETRKKAQQAIDERDELLKWWNDGGAPLDQMRRLERRLKHSGHPDDCAACKGE